MEALITYFGQSMRVMCDGKCEKAWGNVSRKKIKLSEDPDDFAFLADDELGIAPTDPHTYEGGVAKPASPEEFPNRWCVRQCERCVEGQVGEKLELKDFTRRIPCY